MSDLTTRVRATTADGPLVTRRRAAQDSALVVGTAVLLLAALVLTLAVPRLVERTADTAVRDTIRAAGHDADVVASPAPPGGFGGTPPDPVADGFASARWLASSLEGAVTAPVVTLTTTFFTARTPAGSFAVRLAHVSVPSRGAQPAVSWVAGTAPIELPDEQQGGKEGAAPDQPRAVQVGMSAAGAATLGIDAAALPFLMRLERAGAYDHVVVTGFYDPVDAADAQWSQAPDLLDALTAPVGATADRTVAAYVPFEALGDLTHVFGTRTISASARAALRTDDLTVESAHELQREIDAIAAVSSRITTGLPGVLDAFDTRMSAARAQASLVTSGVAAAAAACLVLAAGLLVTRRRAFLAAERARGASVASVTWRALLESVPVVVVATLVAAGVVALWLPGYAGSWLLPGAVAVVAALAPAVLAAREAAGAWAGRRTPADRRDRAALSARRGARRTTAEALVVVLAAAALVSVRGRGLVPLGSGDVDPLLAASPVLLAAAAALLVVRVSPAVVRVAGHWAARTRGLAAPLAVARAHGSTTAVVPLLTVTVSVALMVLSGMLVHTVRVGQGAAADALVGAPVRLDGRLGTSTGGGLLDDLASAPGVEHVATGAQVTNRPFGVRTGLTATLLVVDAQGLAAARQAQGLPVDDGLASLGEPGPGGTVPALVSPDLLARADLDPADATMSALAGAIRLDLRGPTALVPDVGAPLLDARAAAEPNDDDGLVVVDRAQLAAAVDRMPDVDRAWVVGAGATAAVEAADIAPAPTSGITVTTRDGWWRAWSQSPLTSALTGMLLAAVGVLACLAVLALGLVVVATARERGRTLSALRTLGLDARTARWATLGELAPLVLGGLVGGTLIGLALPVLLGDALGLVWLTGEPGGTSAALTWWPVAAAVAALTVALVVAVTVERAVRRRDRLGEVLRVGER